MMRHVSHQTVNNEQTNPMQTLADGVTSPTVTSPPAEYTEIASPSQTEKVGFPQKSVLGMRPRMVFPLTHQTVIEISRFGYIPPTQSLFYLPSHP